MQRATDLRELRRAHALRYGGDARLLCAVHSDRIAAGITSGILAASATAGALLGFGLRLGAPARPFNAIAALLLGVNAQALHGFAAAATPLGILLHVVVTIGLGIAYVALFARSGRHPVLWAAAVAATALGAMMLVARLFGVGLAALLPTSNLIALAVVLALALATGMRFALLRV